GRGVGSRASAAAARSSRCCSRRRGARGSARWWRPGCSGCGVRGSYAAVGARSPSAGRGPWGGSRARPRGARGRGRVALGGGRTGGRFDGWAVGGRVVEHHPVLGVGPEGYRVVFPQLVSAEYVRRYGTDVVPDRAHNGVVDVAANGGVVAGALYAALLGVLL